MLIFVLDDEEILLRSSVNMIRETVPEAEGMAFRRATGALRAVTEDGLHPDVVFTDIEMPGMDGLEFAVELKTLCPDAKIIFVTGYILDLHIRHMKDVMTLRHKKMPKIMQPLMWHAAPDKETVERL